MLYFHILLSCILKFYFIKTIKPNLKLYNFSFFFFQF